MIYRPSSRITSQIEKYNKPSNVCQIEISDLEIPGYPSFNFVPEKIKRNIFGRKKIILEHFKATTYFEDKNITAEDLLKITSYGQNKYIIIDNVVYYRSLVEIIFSSDKEDTIYRYFDSLEESKNYVNEFLEKYNLSNELVIIK